MAMMNSFDRDADFICNICYEPWRNTGSHQLASLKCGHFFGQSCIKTWIRSTLTRSRRAAEAPPSCPTCNTPAHECDIRLHYIDTKDYEGLQRQLKELQSVIFELTDQRDAAIRSSRTSVQDKEQSKMKRTIHNLKEELDTLQKQYSNIMKEQAEVKRLLQSGGNSSPLFQSKPEIQAPKFTFGTAKPSTGPFSNNTPFAFGSNQPQAFVFQPRSARLTTNGDKNPNVFTFGTSSSSNLSASAPTQFQFGAAANPSSSSSFGQNPTFGTFSLGSMTATSSTALGSNATQPPVFGTAAVNNPIFGATSIPPTSRQDQPSTISRRGAVAPQQPVEQRQVSRARAVRDRFKTDAKN